MIKIVFIKKVHLRSSDLNLWKVKRFVNELTKIFSNMLDDLKEIKQSYLCHLNEKGLQHSIQIK